VECKFNHSIFSYKLSYRCSIF